MQLAPIIVFAYNRPQYLQQTLEALQANQFASESDLFIFADGPKAGANEDDIGKILEVRKVARKKKWCKNVTFIESELNKGLADSVISGVTKIVNEYGKVIVIEDDVITSPYFLKFMNASLDYYQNEEKVLSIGSWNYFAHPYTENFFLRYPDSIAWATWKRSWTLFEHSAEKAYKVLVEKGLLNRFNGIEGIPYFENMLKAQIEGKVNSWAIRWTATSIIHDKLNWFPALSLSKHIGFGEEATHEKTLNDYNAHITFTDKDPAKFAFSEKMSEMSGAFLAWKKFVTDNFLPVKPKRSLSSKIKDKIKKLKNKYRKGITLKKILNTEPVSKVFGFDRGTPIDRYYIEDFLKKNSKNIKNSVIEIAENTYTEKFGSGVEKSYILSYEKKQGENIIYADLTSTSVPENLVDCFICTQTYNFIYDVKQAMVSAREMLKPEGVLLATVAGICQISRYDDDRWGDFWRFTPTGFKKLASEVFGAENIEVGFYGNSTSAVLLLKGFAIEEIEKKILDAKDQDYPVVITLIAIKK